MFSKSIDNKRKYTDANGYEVLDIGESFMDVNAQNPGLYGIYKVPKDMEMRPDKVSISAYGSDEYTEMVCVFNNIKNPFTIEENDIVYMISLNNIYDNVAEPISEVTAGNKNNGYEVFRDFLDKSRLPKTVGSEKNKTSVSKSTKYINTANNKTNSTANILEAALNNITTAENSSTTINDTGTVLPPNVAKSGANAVEFENNRIIFGANNDNFDYRNNNKNLGQGTTDINNDNTNRKIKSSTATSSLESNKVNDSLGTVASSVPDVTNALDSIENLLNQLGIKDSNTIAEISAVNGQMVFSNDTSVGCAQDGISLGDYMTNKIKNEIK